MKINLLSKYSGNAITRQYKRSRALTYFNSGATGTCFGLSSLFYSAEHTGKSFAFGALGVMFLHDGIAAYKNLLKLAKPYDAIFKRALKIYKHKS